MNYNINNCKKIEFVFYDHTDVEVPFDMVDSIKISGVGDSFSYRFRNDLPIQVISNDCTGFYVYFKDCIKEFCFNDHTGLDIKFIDRVKEKRDLMLVILHFDNEYKAFSLPYAADYPKNLNICEVVEDCINPLFIGVSLEIGITKIGGKNK